MTRDAAFSYLLGEGYVGALEDMLMSFLGGTGSLEDRVYATDPTACGVDNWLMSSTSLTGGDTVTLGGDTITIGGSTISIQGAS